MRTGDKVKVISAKEETTGIVIETVDIPDSPDTKKERVRVMWDDGGYIQLWETDDLMLV